MVSLDPENGLIHLNDSTKKMCWQLIANLGVGNEYTQRKIHENFIEKILKKFNCVCDSSNRRECTMILYNHCIGPCNNRNNMKRIVEFLLECAYSKSTIVDHGLDENDFYRIFFDNFLTNYVDAVFVYDKIEPIEKQIYLLHYMVDHMRAINHQLISVKLLQFICRDFKKKYDHVVKSSNADHLKIVLAELDIIAQASSEERYSKHLNSDASLFLNVGQLLRQIIEIGNREQNVDQSNIFAPIRDLKQLAPNSDGDDSLEREMSYGLKSTLIRIIANLAYKNHQNQELARDANILLSIFDSTNLDARNPRK